MKRFVMTFIALFLLLFGVYYAIYDRGLYWDFNPGAPVTAQFRAGEEYLERRGEDGSYTPLILRGVDVSSAVAGSYSSDYAAGVDDYLRWFEQISDMGANAVRVTTIMDSHFYNAFYLHNTTRGQPLYLLQGVSVPDYAGNNSNDAYGEGFFDKLLSDGMTAVDVIHGRKNILAGGAGGSGLYRWDISPWVIGFMIGTDWFADTVAYTNHSVRNASSYQGQYFATSPDAVPFEAMLAQVMDRVTGHETGKYKKQRPIGFANSPESDFLDYAEVYAKQLQKYVRLNPGHVAPTTFMQAGTFAAYRLYEFCDGFSQYLSEEQKTNLEPLLAGLELGDSYDGYLDLMSKYHSMPVVAAGYGFSSSRGAIRMNQPPLTELEQGARLAAQSRELEELGWAGGFISTWQDTWERRSWNTAFASLPSRSYLWHNLQTEGQGYGLMAFVPDMGGRRVIDGVADDWADGTPVFESGGIRVSASYDAQGLYLLIEKQGLSRDETLYLPIDVSEPVGSFACEAPGLLFDRKADFLLCISGPENSRLLVHERYDAMRGQFLSSVTGENPFISVPDIESPRFVPIQMAVENRSIFDEITTETRIMQRMGTWEAGSLTHGNGDPAVPDYNSLADFRYGNDLVEVRLPWMLLNFYDPSQMLVHDDYYTRYGTDGIPVRRIYIGAAVPADAGSQIQLFPFSLAGWNDKITGYERLKRSYDILRESWGLGNEH